MPASVPTDAELDGLALAKGPPSRGRLVGELATAREPASRLAESRSSTRSDR